MDGIQESVKTAYGDYEIVGGTVTGPGKTENQDCLSVYHDDSRIIVVIADGLGSARLSREGSSKMVSSAMFELRRCEDHSDLGIRVFEKWKSNIEGRLEDYDTTCKFIKITPDKTFYGGIGDGWIAMIGDGGYQEMTSDNVFSNQTESILAFDLTRSFSVNEACTSEIDGALISTDGFSEDFDKERGPQMLSEIRERIIEDPSHYLEELDSLMSHWPVETNCDDKTAIMIARRK